MANAIVGNSDTFDAREQIKNCISCEVSNHTTKSLSTCIKCVQLIVLNQNIDCPHGYTYVKDHDVTLHDYINRTCGTQVPLFMAKTWSVIAGICTGTCISIIVLIVLVVYLHMKKSQSNRSLCKESNSTDSFRSHSLYYSDRPEFLKNVSSLRSQAPVFLSMLNETRRQIRDLRSNQKPPRQLSALQAYRPVLRDLSRILILLNRSPSCIQSTVPPADWETLFAWGERVLSRYKTQNPLKVAQLYKLIDPSDSSGPKEMSSFQPPSHQAAISAFEDKYDMHGDCTILAEWPSSTISRVYIDDDDFDSLGNRPQDTITTEL
ncbi:hypothetical protein M8J76_001675 [Diaphorina citri]|nr:hypothetical protein M8J75_011858 [Diaphorina citri]KAI5723125.1 hypothetical protein M8J76_001675 [Diaphorina citri]KAI5728672.1 hypothetical protein M8J77_019374 [Diaphorina citri]